MAYQVIARKYRPQTFPEVVGQDHVTQTLSRAIEQKRIAHAYIFCGPRGTGKTTIARIFAKCLNCTGGPKVDFDDSDPRCREIAEGRSLDVLEIDGASNNGVEQVRELRETCKYAPASSRYKIYIIDEVHMLTPAAFNALLKTLEEPPEHVKFMFATTDPEKVLPTILSRCQRFDLRRIPAALISKHLSEIASKEKVTIDQAALFAIARGAEGALRDAESTLDQLISFCGDNIQEEDVLSMFGLAAQGQLLALARSILDGEIEPALRQLNTLAVNGKDLGRLLSDLLNHFRNLLIFQVSGGDKEMLEVSEAEGAALVEQSKLAGSDAFTRVLEILSDAEMRLREVSSKKILLEVAILKAIEARRAVSLDSVLQQLQTLRDHAEAAPTPAKAVSAPKNVRSAMVMSEPEPDPATPPITILREESPASVSSTPAPAGDLSGLWSALLEAVGRASPFTRTYLLEAHPVSFARDLLTIGFDPEFEDHLALVDNSRNHTLLQTKLAELGHPNTQIKFIKADAPSPRPVMAPVGAATTSPVPPANPAPPAVLPQPSASRPGPARAQPLPAPAPAKERLASVPFSKDDFKNDPLIQKALELFKGQIVEVRA
jgi:DNA polymerase-3 subunit gamma/tau